MLGLFPSTCLTERRVFSTHADDQHVEGHLSVGHSPLDLRLVADVNDLLLVINLRRFSLVECRGGPFMAQDIPDRLHYRAMLNGTGGAGGQQRGKQEVIPRRDHNDIEVVRIKLLQQRDCAPSSAWNEGVDRQLTLAAAIGLAENIPGLDGRERDALRTQNHQRFLVRVWLSLLDGISQCVDLPRQEAKPAKRAQVSEPPYPAQHAPHPAWLGRRGIIPIQASGKCRGRNWPQQRQSRWGGCGRF